MLKKAMLFGLTAMVASATLAAAGNAGAQPYDPACQRQNNANTTEGAVIGGIAGALLGDVVAGRHEKTEGAILGGVGGAVVGGAVASSNNHPCPPGYIYRAPPPPPGYGPPPPPAYGPPPPPRPDFWYGAPPGVHERIDFIQMRINRGVQNGFLFPDDVRKLNEALNHVRQEEEGLRFWDGCQLSPPDRDRLISQLNDLSHRLHWEEHRDGWDRY